MSADLLAAFGGGEDFDTDSKHSQQASNTGENTGWHSKESDSTWQPWPERQHERHTENLNQPLWQTDSKGSNVLFDAEEPDEVIANEADEDVFGDFEEADSRHSNTRQTPIAKQSHATTTTALLDLEEIEGSLTTHVTHPQKLVGTDSRYSARSAQTTEQLVPSIAPVSSTDAEDEWGEFEDISTSAVYPVSDDNLHGAATKSLTKPLVKSGDVNEKKETVESTKPKSYGLNSQQSASAEDDDFDVWEDFEEPKPDSKQQRVSKAATPASKPPVQSTAAAKSISQERPTNIPPPAVLLSLTSKAFSVLASQTKEPTTEQQNGTHVLQVYKVCARTIAGRSLRWKRDTILSQSMRIGAAGRSGGMKLTSLDKGESRREDQEVEEAIGSWSKHSHKLNAAMVKSRLQKPPMSLSSSLVVRTATGADILVANHPCPVCGLRRNERVNGIDMNVSDTFGEFWVEHWGHKDCHDFWYQFKDLLDQR